MAKQTMLDAAIDNLKAQIAAKQAALAELEEQRARLTRKPRAAVVTSTDGLGVIQEA